MKKLLAFALILALCSVFPSALAAGKLNVVQENFYLIKSYWNYGYVFAKVENAGDRPIKANAGVLEIYDEEGNALTSSDYLNAYAAYLQPGEYTYVKMYAELEDETQNAADHMLTLTGKSDSSAHTLLLDCETALEMGVEDDWWEYNYMYAQITNSTDQILYDIEVVLALLDTDGNILYIADDYLYSERALMPGSSMMIRKDIPSDFMEYFEANGITPAAVDAIAYVLIDAE